MNRNLLVMRAALGLLAWTVLLGGVATAKNVGLVKSAQGEVQVKLPAGDKWIRASAFLPLPENSQLKVGGGGKAQIFLYKDGSLYEANGGSTVTVSEDTPKVVSGPALKRLSTMAPRFAKNLQSSRVAAGRPAAVTLRTREIELQSLASSATLDDRPTFAWLPLTGVTTYRIRVSNDIDEPIWQSEVEGTKVTYPESAPKLKPGVEYVWDINTVGGKEDDKSEGVFRLLPPERRQALQAEIDEIKALPDPQLADVLLADCYERYKLHDDAIPVYKRLAEANPNSTTLLNHLATLLHGQRRGAESEKYKKMAVQAGG